MRAAMSMKRKASEPALTTLRTGQQEAVRMSVRGRAPKNLACQATRVAAAQDRMLLRFIAGVAVGEGAVMLLEQTHRIIFRLILQLLRGGGGYVGACSNAERTP
mmetsp:Transcript_53075/g.141186  ORF Transcript_53075/g.141186 Transcript_53075/m.141186 type:complete len:104 (+) Transcript_53075:131-442(+)